MYPFIGPFKPYYTTPKQIKAMYDEGLRKYGRKAADETFEAFMLDNTYKLQRNLGIKHLLTDFDTRGKEYLLHRFDKIHGVDLINFHPHSGMRHQVLMIDRGDHYEYFDPLGKDYRQLPGRLRSAYELHNKPIHSNTVPYQGDADTCSRHAIQRASMVQLNPDEYKNMMDAGIAKYKEKYKKEYDDISYDELVFALTNGSADAPVFTSTPQSEFKNGGIVIKYGRRTK